MVQNMVVVLFGTCLLACTSIPQTPNDPLLQLSAAAAAMSNQGLPFSSDQELWEAVLAEGLVQRMEATASAYGEMRGKTAKGGIVNLMAGDVPALSTCADHAGFADEFGFTCKQWSKDCGTEKLITQCKEAQGPDTTPCEVGGSGPDVNGNYYPAAQLDHVRARCPVSCGTCPKLGAPGRRPRLLTCEDRPFMAWSLISSFAPNVGQYSPRFCESWWAPVDKLDGCNKLKKSSSLFCAASCGFEGCGCSDHGTEVVGKMDGKSWLEVSFGNAGTSTTCRKFVYNMSVLASCDQSQKHDAAAKRCAATAKQNGTTPAELRGLLSCEVSPLVGVICEETCGCGYDDRANCLAHADWVSKNSKAVDQAFLNSPHMKLVNSSDCYAMYEPDHEPELKY